MNDIIFQGKSNRPLYLITTVWNLCWFATGLAIGMTFLTLTASGLAGALWGNGKLHAPTFAAGIILYILIVTLKILYTICLRKSQLYRLTTKELTTTGGILRKHHKTIRLQEIRSISYQRTLLQQIFNCGDIFISTSATANPSLRLKNIDYVQAVYAQINQHR